MWTKSAQPPVRQFVCILTNIKLKPAVKEAIRKELISSIDQRVKDISLRQSLTLQGKFGLPPASINSGEKDKFGGVEIRQLNPISRKRFISRLLCYWNYCFE